MEVKNISTWVGTLESSTSKARWLYMGLLNAIAKGGNATTSLDWTPACL
jgi:hypothetical protein